MNFYFALIYIVPVIVIAITLIIGGVSVKFYIDEVIKKT